MVIPTNIYWYGFFFYCGADPPIAWKSCAKGPWADRLTTAFFILMCAGHGEVMNISAGQGKVPPDL
jgi:hypothetical protein